MARRSPRARSGRGDRGVRAAGRRLLGERTEQLFGPDRRERGVLLGSGFVGGEGLLGVGIALVAVAKSRRPEVIGTEWLGHEITAMLVGAAAFAVFIFSPRWSHCYPWLTTF